VLRLAGINVEKTISSRSRVMLGALVRDTETEQRKREKREPGRKELENPGKGESGPRSLFSSGDETGRLKMVKTKVRLGCGLHGR